MNLFFSTRIETFAIAILVAVTNIAQAGSIYRITVDTSPIKNQVGYVDLQFNPGIDSLAATVTVRDFVTDGMLAPTSDNIGGASGSLPGPPDAFIANSEGFNDLFQGITFGSSLIFYAEFSGPALDPSSPLPFFGSAFALSLIDSDTVTPLLSTAFDGSLVRIDINPDGSTMATTYPDAVGVFRATATVQSVPEPASLWLLGIGVCGLLGYQTRKVVSMHQAVPPAARPNVINLES